MDFMNTMGQANDIVTGYQNQVARQEQLKQIQQQATDEANQRKAMTEYYNGLNAEHQAKQADLEDQKHIREVQQTLGKVRNAMDFTFNNGLNDNTIQYLNSTIKANPDIQDTLGTSGVAMVNPSDPKHQEAISNYATINGIDPSTLNLKDNYIISYTKDGVPTLQNIHNIAGQVGYQGSPEQIASKLTKAKLEGTQAQQMSAQAKLNNWNNLAPADKLDAIDTVMQKYGFKTPAEAVDFMSKLSAPTATVQQGTTTLTNTSKENIAHESNATKIAVANIGAQAKEVAAQLSGQGQPAVIKQANAIQDINDKLKAVNMNNPQQLAEAKNATQPLYAALVQKLPKDLMSMHNQVQEHLVDYNTLGSKIDSGAKVTGMFDSRLNKIAEQTGIGLNSQSEDFKKAYNSISTKLRHAYYGSALTTGEEANFEKFINSDSKSDKAIRSSIVQLLKTDIGNLETVANSFQGNRIYAVHNKEIRDRLKQTLALFEKGAK